MPPPTPPRADPADAIRARLMRQSLGALLDRAPGARDVLPHLAILERSLAEVGLAALFEIPASARLRMCTQLASLPLPADDAPLLDLQQRLRATLDTPVRDALPPSQRPAIERRAPRVLDDSRYDMERTVVIREISHSEFMAIAGAQLNDPTPQQP